MELTLTQKIIQIMLSENGTIKKADLEKIISSENISLEDLQRQISSQLSTLGLLLINSKNSLQISLSKEVNQELKKQKIEELKSDLSDSALQTLSVILYKPGCTKAEIDFIRGVDSTRSLKNLHLRGLIDKEDQKSRKTYSLTTDTLSFLGLTSEVEVEDYEATHQKLRTLLSQE